MSWNIPAGQSVSGVRVEFFQSLLPTEGGQSRRKKALTLSMHCSAITRTAVFPALPVTPKTWDALKEVTSIPARLCMLPNVYESTKTNFYVLTLENSPTNDKTEKVKIGYNVTSSFADEKDGDIPCSLTATDRAQNSWNSKALNRGTLITERNAQPLISVFQLRTVVCFPSALTSILGLWR